MKALALAIVTALTGCSWTSFSDLSDSTWVHAQETPDSDQSDYGVGIVNATTDSPGELAVLSGAPANYSTLDFDATGSTNETLTEDLSDHSISALSTRPLVIGDGSGDVAIIDKGTAGPLVVIHGAADQLTDSPLSSTDPVDAATFAGSEIVVTSAGNSPTSTKPNAFLVDDATVTNCALVEGAAPLAAAALTSDGTTVWAYARSGDVVGYALSALSIGCDGTQTPGAISPATSVATTAAPAANGGYLALIGSPAKFAIAVAFDSPATATGMVSVVDLSTMTQVGASVATPGVQSATFGTFGTMPALALGFPSHTVGTTANVGQVELHAVDLAAGTVDGDVFELLDIPQAGGDLVFGRALAAMTYNGSTILVVAASNVVYAYYETTLYGDTRQQ